MRLLFFLLLILLSRPLSAQWTNLNTGINDHLTGVVFHGNIGVVSGHKGLYYTTTGGNGAGSWTRFNITGNTADSILYNNTRFNHCEAKIYNSKYNIFACGIDTSTQQAVIIRLIINAGIITYDFIYTGSNSSLNHIGHNVSENSFTAVGDNGLIIRFDTSGAAVLSTSITADLNAIDYFGSSFWISANNQLFQGTDNPPNFTFSTFDSTGHNINGVSDAPPFNGLRAVGDGYFYLSYAPTLDENHLYDFGPLNGRTIFRDGYDLFIGTDHGVFRSSGNSYTYLEWQPSSMNHVIDEFYLNTQNSSIYACGANGVVLVTSNAGGDVKPYVNLDNLFGNCVNQYFYFISESGSATSCAWYIDGLYQSSSCNYGHSFATTGTYDITLIGFYGSESDTATQTIYIVDTPTINLPVTISDSVLCKQETIQITVDSSQNDVHYLLKKHGSSGTYGSSSSGNNSAITFTTAVLDETGDYYLRASSDYVKGFIRLYYFYLELCK